MLNGSTAVITKPTHCQLILQFIRHCQDGFGLGIDVTMKESYGGGVGFVPYEPEGNPHKSQLRNFPMTHEPLWSMPDPEAKGSPTVLRSTVYSHTMASQYDNNFYVTNPTGYGSWAMDISSMVASNEMAMLTPAFRNLERLSRDYVQPMVIGAIPGYERSNSNVELHSNYGQASMVTQWARQGITFTRSGIGPGDGPYLNDPASKERKEELWKHQMVYLDAAASGGAYVLIQADDSRRKWAEDYLLQQMFREELLAALAGGDRGLQCSLGRLWSLRDRGLQCSLGRLWSLRDRGLQCSLGRLWSLRDRGLQCSLGRLCSLRDRGLQCSLGRLWFLHGLPLVNLVHITTALLVWATVWVPFGAATYQLDLNT
jgi:hypothetical protein